MKLTDLSGKEVEKGTVIKDFLGDEWKVLVITPPHKPSSTGKILVCPVDTQSFQQEFFPSVFCLTWENVS